RPQSGSTSVLAALLRFARSVAFQSAAEQCYACGVAAAVKRKILIIEDEPHIVLGLEDALRFEGFNVASRCTGRAGVEAVKVERPDCILLDLMLPDMNGYQVCEHVRRTDPAVPIVMLTARSQEADKIRGLDAGADDYVTKPFSVGELV